MKRDEARRVGTAIEQTGTRTVGGRLVAILELLAKFDEFLLEGQEAVADRVRQIDVVHGRIGEPLALRLNDPGGHADDGRIGSNVLEDDGIGADLHVVTDRNPSEDLGPGADHDVIAQRRMPLPALLSRSTERHPWKSVT